MKKELSVVEIYNDFIDKMILSDIEIEILKKYVKNETITKISVDLNMGTASVSRVIAEIKRKYEIYKQVELARLMILLGEK